MTWENPSAILTQFRTQLLLCQRIIDEPLVEARFHYPSADIHEDTMPYCVLSDIGLMRTRYAEGAVPLISGTLVSSFYFPATRSTGYLETFARDVIAQLGEQYSGLAIKSSETQLSSELTSGQRADGNNDSQSAYRTVTMTFNYGLSR